MDHRLIRMDGWELTLISVAKCSRDLISEDSPTLIVDINDPAIVGITATLSCHGLNHTLIGPNTTCMGNGEWDPDRMEAKCKGHPNRPLHTCIYFEKHETIPYSRKFFMWRKFLPSSTRVSSTDFYPAKCLSQDNDCI